MAAPKKLSQETIGEMRRMRGCGMSFVTIAAEVGVSADTVRHHLQGLQKGPRVPVPVNTTADRIRARFASGCQPRWGR